MRVLILRLGRRFRIMPVLQQLHWLSIKHRITFTVATLMHCTGYITVSARRIFPAPPNYANCGPLRTQLHKVQRTSRSSQSVGLPFGPVCHRQSDELNHTYRFVELLRCVFILA